MDLVKPGSTPNSKHEVVVYVSVFYAFFLYFCIFNFFSLYFVYDSIIIISSTVMVMIVMLTCQVLVCLSHSVLKIS